MIAPKPTSEFTVIAIIAAYNEADIIDSVIGDLVDQGVGVYFLDDRSTDGTAEIVARRLGRGILAIERLSDTSTDLEPTGFQWDRILRRKAELAHQLDADWFIHQDADEFRESPWPGCSLKGGIQAVDSLGFNAIEFLCLNFWPTHDHFRGADDVRERSIHPLRIGGSLRSRPD